MPSEHDAEPREDRHVVDGRRRLGRQADPPQRRRVEERARRGTTAPADDDRRGDRDQPDRQPQEGQRQHARHGDLVEDAEEDEGVRDRTTRCRG